MVKYLQRVPLDASINWRYLHQDSEQNLGISMRSYWKYSKATICRHMENSIEDWKNIEYCKKRVMVKAVIPPSITKKTVDRVIQKTELKSTHFHWKGIITLTKNNLKLRLTFNQKVCCKHAMCNNEI